MATKIKRMLTSLSILLLFASGCGRETQPTRPEDSLETRLASGSGKTLEVRKSGTGAGTVTSSPSGINCGSSCSKSFSRGTNVTLTATPAAGSVFAGWSGGGCSGTGTCTVNLRDDMIVTATFNAAGGGGSTFTLTVNKVLSGQGNGTVTSTPSGINCGSTCVASFPAGTSITLFASPSAGQFTGWTAGPCVGSANPSCTFTLNANTTATAAFASSQAPQFIESTLPNGNVGADYSAFINTTGGSGGQDIFSIVAGSLPDGLEMEPFFGVQSTLIHGRPDRTQTSTFTVRVQDDGGSATRTFTITIDGAVPIAITLPGPTARPGTVGAFYFQNLFGSGGETPYEWSITGGQLPPGLRLVEASNGNRIEGTPTTAGTFTFILTMEDRGGQRVSQQTSITIS